MDQNTLIIPRASDGTILNVFLELADLYEPHHMSVTVTGFQGAFDPRAGNSKEIAERIREKNSNLIFQASIGFLDISIAFTRGGDSNSGIFDSLKITKGSNSPQATPQTRLEIISLLESRFKAVNPAQHLRGNATDAQALLEAAHNSILQRLEQAATDQISNNSDHLRKLEEDYTEKRKALEAELALKKIETEKWRQDEKKEIEKEKADLEKREREIDDRQNTHARRALQKELRSKFTDRQQSFKLTQGTRLLRLPIHAICIVLLFGLATLLNSISIQTWDLLKNWQSNPSNDILRPDLIYVFIKNITVAAAFAGLGLIYLRWMNRWFEKHAEAEFLIKGMELDVDRASWVVETALEWHNQVKEPMPANLMSSVSHNLFNGSNPSIEDPRNPADELASALFGSAGAKAKINSNGEAEIEFNPSKIKKTA